MKNNKEVIEELQGTIDCLKKHIEYLEGTETVLLDMLSSMNIWQFIRWRRKVRGYEE